MLEKYGEAPISSQEIQNQIERIVASSGFCQSKSVERFLRYVTTETLYGRGGQIKEFTIATEALGRDKDFDPKSNPIVRVQARVLRERLNAYYEHDGAGDPIDISFRKGSYIPQFSRRADVEGWKPSARLRLAVAFFCGMIGILAVQQVWPKVLRTAPRPADRKSLAPVWNRFFDSGVPTVVSFGTPQFYSGKGMHFRDIRADNPGSPRRVPLQAVERALGVSLSPSNPYTGVGDAQAMYAISRFFFDRGRDISVVRSQSMGWDDLKSSNVVLLSTMRFQNFASPLPLPMDFVLSNQPSAIENLRPRPGEERFYRHLFFPGGEYDHAVVTVWPGLHENRRIMLISGYTTWSTQAAAEFIVKPENLREIEKSFGTCSRPDGEHSPFFQLLLRVHIRDKQPIRTTYLTHHDLSVDPFELQRSPRN